MQLLNFCQRFLVVHFRVVRICRDELLLMTVKLFAAKRQLHILWFSETDSITDSKGHIFPLSFSIKRTC